MVVITVIIHKDTWSYICTYYVNCFYLNIVYFTILDVGGIAAADGATYTAPADIPYKFGMVAQVSGYHRVLSVTSTSDKLKVSTTGDQSTMVGAVLLGKVRKKASIRNRYNKHHN